MSIFASKLDLNMKDSATSFYDFEGNFFDANTLPQQLEDGGIFICLSGEADFFLDLKHYRLKAGDMCVAFPASILQPVHKSNDFEGFGIGVTTKLFNNILLPSPMDYYLYIKDNPCISLTDDERKVILESCQLMIQKSNCHNHPFLQEITNSLFRVVYCEIAAVYKKSRPITQEVVSRKELLARKFLFLMAKKYIKHREVDYYARELCVTPRYLSSVIKEKTGNNASFWINDMVIRQAKNLLQNSNLSVLQISDELNFPTPSFFGQYFKKHTGMTPKKFRDIG
jgi:AraC-like DNA-binding protein